LGLGFGGKRGFDMTQPRLLNFSQGRWVGNEFDNRGAPAAGFGWGIVERTHEWQSSQQGMDACSLDATALAVDEADRGESGSATLGQVFFNNAMDFIGTKRVQIQYIFKRQDNWIGKRGLFGKLLSLADPIFVQLSVGSHGRSLPS
jgi:hypothetical protein